LPKEPGDETKPPEKEKPAGKGKAASRGIPPPGEEKAALVDREAVLVVWVMPGATLTMDDEPTTLDGEVRRFITPRLKAGRRYFYMAKATWAPDAATFVTRTRKAYVEAGKTTELDMRKEDPSQPDEVLQVSTRGLPGAKKVERR
jgi:uncharacterized protein (TIGR03000 family)